MEPFEAVRSMEPGRTRRELELTLEGLVLTSSDAGHVWACKPRDIELMQPSVRQRLVKRLAAIAVAGACGIIDPVVSLLGIPTTVLADVFDDDALEDDDDDCRQVVHLLVGDPRPAVRALVAEAAPTRLRRSFEEAHELVRQLASDSSARVRHAAAKGLASLLERASPIDRVEIVCQWTVSTLATERLAIARALRAGTPVLVADLAIEQLALDDDAQVRLAAVRAAARHSGESPEFYKELALKLTLDSSRLVRRGALRLLEGA
jgi:hypothetical protein